MRKPAFCICENKDADQLRGTAKLISAFVFATQIVLSRYFLNPKSQVSNSLLWLYSLVCVGPGRKPRRPVFSQRGSIEPSLGTKLVIGFFTLWLKINLLTIAIAVVTLKLSCVTKKPVFGVSDQVRHKLGCTAIEDG